MSAINAMGQAVFQYIQNEKSAQAADTDRAQPAAQNDPNGGGNNGAATYSGQAFTPAGEALLMVLQQYGIDAGQFERDFLAAMKRFTLDRMMPPLAKTAPSLEHINAVG
jgi:hypothetical protein